MRKTRVLSIVSGALQVSGMIIGACVAVFVFQPHPIIAVLSMLLVFQMLVVGVKLSSLVDFLRMRGYKEMSQEIWIEYLQYHSQTP